MEPGAGCQGNQVEHWLNNIKVVEFERGSQIFRALVQKSKYAEWPNFGEWESGPIPLQRSWRPGTFQKYQDSRAERLGISEPPHAASCGAVQLKPFNVESPGIPNVQTPTNDCVEFPHMIAACGDGGDHNPGAPRWY